MKRPILLLIVLLMVAIPFAASAQDAETVVIRGFGNIVSFNPLFTNDGASYQAWSVLWPAPFDVDRDSGEAVPGLTSWEISEDGLTYTFTIRADANWSDGTPITSADMKFVLDAIDSEAVATVFEANTDLIDSVNIIDDKTYEIVLQSPDCAALSSLGGVRFLPSHKFAADFSDIETNTLNTDPDISGGPYILEDWEPDSFQSYVANDSYFKGVPGIPRLINRVIGEQAVALQSIQAGEIDYTYFQGDLFQQIQNRDNLQWEIFPQMSVNFLSMNWADPTNPQAAHNEDGSLAEQTPHPIFSDINVRKAVAMGYNKADILATLGGDEGGTPLIGPVNPGIGWAYAGDIEPYAFDQDAAKALLEEAGWVDSDGDGIREKDGVKLSFTISYSDILLFFETTALVAQDQLTDVGFEVNLQKYEWADYLSTVYSGQQYDVTPMSNSGGTGGPPDPNDFMTLILSTEDIPGSGNNLSSYVNEDVDALIAEGRNVPGCVTDGRADIYRQIQQITHDEVAYDWTFVPNIWQTANSRILNFNPGPSWVFYGYTSFVNEWAIGE